jgi:hypothetical protein
VISLHTQTDTAAPLVDQLSADHSSPVGACRPGLASRHRRGREGREREKKLAQIERYSTKKRGKRDRGPEGGGPGPKTEGLVRRKLMRLLSLVPFGCRAGPIDDAPPPVDHAAAAAARRRRRRRANRAAQLLGAAAGAPQQWRPSLGDICEEYSSSTDAVKVRKAASWDLARALPRAHGGKQYRYLSIYLFIYLSEIVTVSCLYVCTSNLPRTT